MNEADVKRKIVKSVQKHGGYARRFEDQFAVGILDTILIPRGLPVFMAEVKMIRGSTFSPTPRQYVELIRVKNAAYNGGHVIPVMIGYKDGNYYFHELEEVIHQSNCFSITTTQVEFHDQLVKYYHYKKAMT